MCKIKEILKIVGKMKKKIGSNHLQIEDTQFI